MKHTDRRYRVEPQTHAAYEVSDSLSTGAVTGYREGIKAKSRYSKPLKVT